MLVECYQMTDGKRTLIAKSDIPEERAKELRVGSVITLASVTPTSSQVGFIAIPEHPDSTLEDYRITEIIDRKTKNGTNYRECIVVERFP